MRWLSLLLAPLSVTLAAALWFVIYRTGATGPPGSFDITYVDIITIILTALSLLLTVMAIFLAVAAVWGFSAIKDEAVREATKAAQRKIEDRVKVEVEAQLRPAFVELSKSPYIEAGDGALGRESADNVAKSVEDKDAHDSR